MFKQHCTVPSWCLGWTEGPEGSWSESGFSPPSASSSHYHLVLEEKGAASSALQSQKLLLSHENTDRAKHLTSKCNTEGAVNGDHQQRSSQVTSWFLLTDGESLASNCKSDHRENNKDSRPRLKTTAWLGSMCDSDWLTLSGLMCYLFCNLVCSVHDESWCVLLTESCSAVECQDLCWILKQLKTISISKVLV